MMIFSSKENKSLINRVFTERSKLQNRSQSSEIEEALLASILPTNEQAQFVIRMLYTDHFTLQRAFSSVFESYSGAGEARWSNGFPVLQLFSDFSRREWLKVGHEEIITSDFESDFGIVVDILKHHERTTHSQNPLRKASYAKSIEHSEKLLALLQERSDEVPVQSFIAIIAEHWNVLSLNIYTYRALANLSALAMDFPNSPADKDIFNRILTEVSSTWDEQDRKNAYAG